MSGFGVRPALQFGQEMLEYAIPVLGREVATEKRDAEQICNAAGIPRVGFGAAGAIDVVFLPVLHEQTADIPSRALEQQAP